MIGDAEAAEREVAAFHARRSPEGRFLSYCRGRARHFAARQVVTAFCAVVFLRVGDAPTALQLAALVFFADACESLVLHRLAQRRSVVARLAGLRAATAAMAGLQALAVAVTLHVLVAAGGDVVRGFGAAVCLAAALDAGLHFGLNRPAALARVGVYLAAIAALFVLPMPDATATGTTAATADRAFFDAMAVVLLGMVLTVFLRHVQGARLRAAGKQEMALIAARDLAAANAALADSRAEAARLAMVAEQVGESIVITNPAGEITWVNRAFTDILGYTPHEAVGQHVSLLNGPETGAEAVDILMTARRYGRAARTEIVNHRRDGSPIWMETSLTPVLDADGTVTAMISVERDISGAKAREAALAEATQAAEAASRAKQEFLATVSHEIRTPLNGILGNAELLGEAPLPPESRAMARTITRSGEALLQLVNDILDLSALDGRQLTISEAPFALEDCLSSVADLMRPLAARKGLRFVVEPPDRPPPPLLGDAGRLRQVLANLLGNAIKFTESGSVTLSARVAPADAGAPPPDAGDGEPALPPGAAPDAAPPDLRAPGGAPPSPARPVTTIGQDETPPATGPERHDVDPAPPAPGDRTAGAAPPDTGAPRLRLRLTVRDTGIGIRQDRLEAIFDPFAQADGGVAGRFGGTGLGLSISRQLAEAMGGTLTVASRPGAGSAFVLTLELPRADAASPDGTPATAGTPAPDLAGRRILVADDNAANLRIVRALLAPTGATVETVTSGRDALTAWRERAPDLVLMDMRMADLDGPSATRAIRIEEAADARPPVPIVALTANAMADAHEACTASGMTGFLTKPLRRADLYAALDRALPADRAALGQRATA